MGAPGSPTIVKFASKHQAYGHVAAELSQATATGRDLEVTVEPWQSGWRVVVFDQTAGAAETAAAVRELQELSA